MVGNGGSGAGQHRWEGLVRGTFLAGAEGRLWRQGRKKGFNVGKVEGNNDGVRNSRTCILFEGVQDSKVRGESGCGRELGE